MTLRYATSTYGTGVLFDVGTVDSFLVLRESTLFSENNYAIVTAGTGQSVQVLGLVGGARGIAMINQLGGSSLNTIDVARNGSISTEYVAISVQSIAITIINSGEIRSSNGAAISLTTALDKPMGTVVNYGVISGESGGITMSTGGALSISNYGTIGNVDPLNFAVITDDGNDLLVNRGTIEGRVNLWLGDDVLRNRGLIAGKVDMLDGNDRVDTIGGTIDGAILLGAGDDTLLPGLDVENADGGQGTDTLDFSRLPGVVVALDGSLDNAGGAAGDSYTAFENIVGSQLGDDTLVGDAGANLLQGLGGKDALYGQAGADTLAGGRGADTLDGGDGDDQLDGGEGSDSLFGGLGADTLTGGAGNDTLTGGGAGRDLLTGGAGADKFAFTLDDVAGTSVAAANYDQILDFTRADKDKIVLSAIDAKVGVAGDQAFAFIGTAAFHNVAGELRISPVDGGYAVMGDTNGDGVADFVIGVTTSAALVAGDFVL